MGRRPKVYAIYEDDDIIGVGTVRELAVQLNKTISTIKHYIAGDIKFRKGVFNRGGLI